MKYSQELKEIKETPVFALQSKAFSFQKLVHRDPIIPSNNSSKSGSSNSERTPESDYEYLNSPKQPGYDNIYTTVIEKNLEPQTNCFIGYRRFLGKAVPVVRRKQLPGLSYTQISNIKLETPKKNKSNGDEARASIYGVTLAKDLFISKRQNKMQALPILMLQQLKLEEMNRLIQKLKIRKRSKLGTISCTKSSINFSKSKTSDELTFNNNFSQTKGKLNFQKLIKINGKTNQFLPARKRYIFQNNPI